MPSASPIAAQVKIAKDWSAVSGPPEAMPTTTTAISSADRASSTPRRPRHRPATNGGTARAPSTAWVPSSVPATSPTNPASSTTRGTRSRGARSSRLRASSQPVPRAARAMTEGTFWSHRIGPPSASSTKPRAAAAMRRSGAFLMVVRSATSLRSCP